MKMSKSERSSYLALQETKEPLYTVPSGFRSVRTELNIDQWEKS